MNKRRSFIESEFRAKETEDKLIVEGYFIKYNSETKLFDDVYEEVDPLSTLRSIKENDIRGLFNHDTSLVLGRTGNDTLKLRSDEIGLYGEIEINREDSGAMDAYARIKRGDVVGCSFGFMPMREDYEKRADGGEKFIIREMDLFEVSPCVFPAYPQTEIAARKHDVEEIRKQKLETLRKEKLNTRKEQLKRRFTK